MAFIVGFLIATLSLVASIYHLGQTAASYYDFVGVTMVLGGTIAVAVIMMPWQLKKEIKYRLTQLIVKKDVPHKDLLEDCVEYCHQLSKGNYGFQVTVEGTHGKILKDGAELIQLGFKPENIESVLKERLYQHVERAKTVGSTFKSLAKYPPAFGLAGTVLGLVHLMRGVSDGMSPQETGVRMAIALVATFYGLLVANLLVSPVGEAIFKNATEDEKLGEIALQTVLLAAERVNLLETQEMLNSYVDESDRVDMFTKFSDFESESESESESVEQEGAA